MKAPAADSAAGEFRAGYLQGFGTMAAYGTAFVVLALLGLLIFPTRTTPEPVVIAQAKERTCSETSWA